MKYMKVKPKDGHKVRVPYQHRYLLEQGEQVLRTVYWKRQLEAGKIQPVNEPFMLGMSDEETE